MTQTFIFRTRLKSNHKQNDPDLYFFFSLDSMFISVEDRTGRIRFSYNYSMSFPYSQEFITKQAGDTFCTRSYGLIY